MNKDQLEYLEYCLEAWHNNIKPDSKDKELYKQYKGILNSSIVNNNYEDLIEKEIKEAMEDFTTTETTNEREYGFLKGYTMGLKQAKVLLNKQ